MTIEPGLKAKLQALANMTEANGCTPEEAANAAAKLQALLIAHRLASIDALGTNTSAKSYEKQESGFESGRTWRDVLVNNVALVNGVRCIRAGGKLLLFGEPEAVEIVRYFAAHLVTQVDVFAMRYAYGNGRRYVNSYRNGMVQTIVKRLNEEKQRAVETSGERGMVLVRDEKALDAAFRNAFGRMRAHVARTRVNHGFEHGIRDGARVGIYKPVGQTRVSEARRLT